MNFIKAYKYPLGITLGLIAIFFIFQNGTCSSGDTTAGTSTAATATSTTTSSVLTVSPATVSVTAGGTVQFTATGGSGNYNFSTIGGGTITPSGGYFVAPASGSVEVAVQDVSTGLYGYALVTVGTGTTTSTGTTTTSTVTLAASASSVSASGVVTFTVSGGTAPYNFLVLSGGGGFPSANSFSTSGMTASYTAPSSSTGLVEVEVTDVYSNASNVVSLTVTSAGPTGSTTSTAPAKIIAITSNSVFQDKGITHSPSHAIDGDISTFYSSTIYNSATPATMPFLEMTLGDSNGKGGVFAVTHINITARGANTGSIASFPPSYVIKANIVGGNGWTPVGTFTTQPDFDGVARVTFSTPVNTDKLAFIPTVLGKDPVNYYFQISELGF